ncbi:MAG: thioredoxin domain-containing protein [Gemmatimonadales bacterium]|nr:thioredoxin domain-containing protein [Gemmatimonadales bacterium]NIN12855.1 thioredoxin domain-containing protein [Gemmatimonadales bacterium]NIN51033.1 thioredoxin domain-containing protein [Gemmatimonadales bacterium]NIP08497.1 thioredoxin domain-containing protein [Gemmatimonadales bacterium]NIR02537.1 thioredoxin domain-containing protein [Gemmatimonadales bacterium]
MAGPVNLKPFYVGLGVVAVAGIAAIWWAKEGGSEARAVDPVPVSAGSFAGYVLGSDSAPVEIVEYADFECGGCAYFAILTGPDVKNRLVSTGRVRWRFRDFPLPQHRNAPAAHLAAACAGEQGRFWEMHDHIFFNQGAWVSDNRPARRFRDYARALGLDLDQYEACMDQQRYAARIQASKDEGVALGVNSTPSFIIGDILIPAALSYDSLVKLVERAERAK